MKFITPKNTNKQKITVSVSYKTKLLIEYYAKYTEYEQGEVLDQFLDNLLLDEAFIAWLHRQRNKKKIEEILLSSVSSNEKEVANGEFENASVPFCKHYGKDQKRFTDIKNKPSRYRLGGSVKGSKQLKCNDIIGPDFTDIGLDCTIEPLSNWAVAEEVKRLKLISAITDRKQDYVFHRETCEYPTATPVSKPSRIRTGTVEFY